MVVVLGAPHPELLSLTWSHPDGALAGTRVLDLAEMDRLVAAANHLHHQWRHGSTSSASPVPYLDETGGRLRLDLNALLDDLLDRN